MEEAAQVLMVSGAKAQPGPVIVINELVAPHNRLWDLDNFNKAILDCLKRHGVIEDDNFRIVREITAKVGNGPVGASVTVRSV